MKITLYFVILLTLFLNSCSKENRRERLLAGNWELKNIHTIDYENNQEVNSKDTTYYGLLQLQNGPDVVEGNDAYFTDFEPFPTTFCYWEVSKSKDFTLNFYLWNIDANIKFDYLFKVEKLSRKKLIIEREIFDENNNLIQIINIEFVKG